MENQKYVLEAQRINGNAHWWVTGHKEIGKFSYDVVQKIGVKHSFSEFLPDEEISKEQLDKLIYFRNEEIAYQRRYADLPAKELQILNWESYYSEPNKEWSKKLQINVVINGVEIGLYSNDMSNTILKAFWDVEYARLSIKPKQYDYYLELAFASYNQDGNHNEFQNEGFFNALIEFLKQNEVEICKEFGYQTKLEMEQEEESKRIAEEERKKRFEAAKPNDLVDSGFGYMVEKRNYKKAQKMGFDGIENL